MSTVDATKSKPAKRSGTDKSQHAPVNIAIFGHGRWGKNLVRQFNELPEASLAAICDPDPAQHETVTCLYPHTRLATEKSILNDGTI